MINPFKATRKKRKVKALLKDYLINTKPYEMAKDSYLNELSEKIDLIYKP